MKIEKLFWSKTKTDIMKYLLFRRQWVSLRALESDLSWSFPAIKKQVDLLEEAEILSIDKINSKWSVYMNEDNLAIMKMMFMQSLKSSVFAIFNQYDSMLSKIYFGKVFGNEIEADMVIIYDLWSKEHLDKVKEEISETFREYFIEIVSVVFLSKDDFDRRYRLSDKFVLNIIRNCNE